MLEGVGTTYREKGRDRSLWRCECDCGNVCEVVGSSLTKKNPTTSCGCFHKERMTVVNGLRPHEATYNKLIANSRKFNVDLTFEEFLKFTDTPSCHYCMASILWRPYCATRYNLDRKNNLLGYSKENCVVCCPRCNLGKLDLFTYEEWYEMTAMFRRRYEQAGKIQSGCSVRKILRQTVRNDNFSTTGGSGEQANTLDTDQPPVVRS